MNSNDQPPPSGPLDFQPRRGNDKAMLTQLAHLGNELTALKMTVEVIRSNYVTKEDLMRVEGALRTEIQKEFTKQTWRVVGFVTTVSGALAAAVYYIARYVH
jgi:hypothetical protein